jgi:hypothetical protein
MSSSNIHQVGHFEIPADDVENLKNFYGSLFGWQFERGETQGYYMIKNAGISGALTQKENPQQLSTQFVRVGKSPARFSSYEWSGFIAAFVIVSFFVDRPCSSSRFSNDSTFNYNHLLYSP